MGLFAYFQQKIARFQHRISTYLFLKSFPP